MPPLQWYIQTDVKYKNKSPSDETWTRGASQVKVRGWRRGEGVLKAKALNEMDAGRDRATPEEERERERSFMDNQEVTEEEEGK